MTISSALKIVLSTSLVVVGACSSAPKAFDKNASMAAQTDQYVQEKNGDDFSDIKKVIIPYFQVEYVVKSSASATAFAKNGGSATAKQLFELNGVSDEHMQKMTDRYYENLVAELKASGHEVVPHEELLKMKSYQAFEKWHKPTPHLISRNSSSGKFFSYKAMPTYFIDGDQRLSVTNAFGSAFTMGKRPASLEEDLEKESGAKVLRARFVVDFVSQAGHVTGNMASVDADYRVTLAPQFTSLTVPTEGILVTLKEPLFTGTNSWVKSVNELNSASNRAISGVTAVLGNTHSAREYVIETEVPAWDSSVSEIVTASQKMFFSKMK